MQDNLSIIRWLASYKLLKNYQHCNIEMSFQKQGLNFVDGFFFVVVGHASDVDISKAFEN